MINDFTVEEEHRDRVTGAVTTRIYMLDSYTENANKNLMKVIGNVEEAFVYLTGGKQKEDWPEDVFKRFQLIRHKLLDEANKLNRLPNVLRYKGTLICSENLNETLARILNRGE